MQLLSRYYLIMMGHFRGVQSLLADNKCLCDWRSELEYTEELAERKQRFAHRSYSHKTITKPRP